MSLVNNILNIVRYHAVGSLTVHVSLPCVPPPVKQSSLANNILNIVRYHAVGSLTVHVRLPCVPPPVKQSSITNNILNIVRYHAVGSLTSVCIYHVSHHQCSLSSSSVKVTRLCFSRSRRYIRREKKGCTVLSLPPTRHSTGIFCEKNGQVCFTKQQKAKHKTNNL